MTAPAVFAYTWEAGTSTPVRALRDGLRVILHSLPGEVVDDVVLMAVEVATNALRHAAGPYRCVVGLAADGSVECEVEDHTPQAGPDLIGGPGAGLAVSGRGWQIVRALSGGRCGVRRDLAAKAVWFVRAT